MGRAEASPGGRSLGTQEPPCPGSPCLTRYPVPWRSRGCLTRVVHVGTDASLTSILAGPALPVAVFWTGGEVQLERNNSSRVHPTQSGTREGPMVCAPALVAKRRRACQGYACRELAWAGPHDAGGKSEVDVGIGPQQRGLSLEHPWSLEHQVVFWKTFGQLVK